MSLKEAPKPDRFRAIIKPGASFRIIRFLFLLIGLMLIGGFVVACNSEDDSTPEESTITDPAAAEGETIFKQNCATCHAVTGETIVVGPSLAGIAAQAATRVEGQSAADYIQISILHPDEYIVEGFSDLMPSNFGTSLSGEQLDALLAYLMTLE